MAAIHDLKCVSPECGREQYDVLVIVDRLPACLCGAAMEIRWDISRRQAPVTLNTTVHPRERTVVWKHPQTGSVAYTPEANAPMPARYRNAGYERVEFDSLKKLDKFCAEKNVTNEKANFDSNGRADSL